MPDTYRQTTIAVIGTLGLTYILTGIVANVHFAYAILGIVGVGLVGGLSVLVIFAIGWWYTDREQSVSESILDTARRVAERTGLLDPKIVVEGAVPVDEDVWVCRYRRDQSVEICHRVCPNCKLELVERHLSTGSRSGRAATDGGVTEDVLACPHCTYASRGEKHEKRGSDAARSKFEDHLESMRGTKRTSLQHWETRAEQVLGRSPSPADVWDEYAKTTNGAVEQRTVETPSGVDRRAADTYEAFAELKRTRDLRTRVVEHFPTPVDHLLLDLFRSEYLERKEEMKHQRDRARTAYEPVRRRLRDSRGETLDSLTTARAKREWPPDSVERSQLEPIRADVKRLVEIGEEYDRFLTGAELESIDRIDQQFENAMEYLEECRPVREAVETAREAVRSSEDAFEPYADYDTYLPSDRRETLDDRLNVAERAVEELQQTVDGETIDLPTDATEASRTLETRVTDLRESLENHEERLIRHEEEQYPNVFETEHGPLNEKQKRAVVRDERHNLVDASAGTGKTLTLTRRFRYLYQKGTRLEDIVAITFTRDAAEEMKGRLSDTLGGVDEDRLNIQTIHDLAREIITRHIYGSIDGGLKDGADEFLTRVFEHDREFVERHPELLGELKSHQEDAVAAEGEEFEDGSDGSAKEAVRDRIESAFETARNFDRSPDALREATDMGDSFEYHVTYATAALLELFETEKRDQEQPIDHDHCIEMASELLDEFSSRYEDEYEHVLVDEFQDVSEQILDFVQDLLGPETHLFAVGDDWQSIYGFRGSTPAFFRNFEERFEGTGRTTLEVNYRCSETIVDASVAVMERSEEATEKAVRADADGGADPVVHRLGGPFVDRRGAYVADLVEEIHDDSVEYRDITILYPVKRLGWDVFGPHLDERDIPVDVQNGMTTASDSEGSVTAQTIHKSKGTEADHVIVTNLLDDRRSGLPRSERVDRGVGPAAGQTADHFEEERRVFYVATTRAEETLHFVTRADVPSRFLDEISAYTETVEDAPSSVEGKVTEIQTRGGRAPDVVTVDCGTYVTYIATWSSEIVDELTEGDVYRIEGLEENYDYGDDFRTNEETTVRKVD